MIESGAHDRAWDLYVSPWHLDEHLLGFPTPVGAVELPGLPQEGGDLPRRLADRYRRVATAVAESTLPLVLAGDCLTALGCVGGVQWRRGEISVIWLDAHGDFNTPAISDSGYLAGMSLAMLTGRSPQTISEPAGVRPVPDRRVALIGARDLDPAERDALDASQILRVAAEPEAVARALRQRPAGDVYLHIDVDLIDGTEIPGLRWETSEGPSLETVQECLARIIDAASPVGVCIACPWSAQQMSVESTRLVLTRLATAIGASLTWPSKGTDSTERDRA